MTRSPHLRAAVVAASKAGRGCINWTGAPTRQGYGRAYNPGGTRSPAHRVVWKYVIGPITDDLTLDHKCFNTMCVNPRHLRPMTSQRSASKPRCKSGHAFTPENTYIKTKSGRRSCRACNRAAVARYTARKKESAA